MRSSVICFFFYINVEEFYNHLNLKIKNFQITPCTSIDMNNNLEFKAYQQAV